MKFDDSEESIEAVPNLCLYLTFLSPVLAPLVLSGSLIAEAYKRRQVIVRSLIRLLFGADFSDHA